MTSSLVDAGVALFCLSLSAWCYRYNRRCYVQHSPVRGYILENQVTHARLLPLQAAHAFTYPTLALFVSVDALESHELDLWKGAVFGYGGRWGRLTGLRSNSYLADVVKEGDGSMTIRKKLDDLLFVRGFSGTNGESLIEDAWMLTMPSYLGFEGINPLTVYFCYKTTKLWLVLLEIHNTFGESHVHVLEAGQNEDPAESRPKGFDNQWTFLREFHVSPFNDRSGFYTISVKCPSHSSISNSHDSAPRPAIRVHLHASSDNPDTPEVPGPLKLTALLRSTASYPLTSTNLFISLFRAPFTLFLSLPRIFQQAWILHYRKRLDVFLRPEPLPSRKKRKFATWSGLRWGGGVKWLGEGFLEGFARRRVQAFIEQRVEEAGLQVSFVSADPAVQDVLVAPRTENPQGNGLPHLVISFLAPRVFPILFTTPSAEHALLLGSDTERIFSVSSRDLFIKAFSAPPQRKLVSTEPSPLQSLRARQIPEYIPLHIPTVHPLDPMSSRIEHVKVSLALQTLFFLEKLERWIFSVTHARVVPGEEPWKVWERAEKFIAGVDNDNAKDPPSTVRKEWGSVCRAVEGGAI